MVPVTAKYIKQNLHQYQSIKYFLSRKVSIFITKKQEDTPMATHDNQSSLTKQKAFFRQFEITASIESSTSGFCKIAFFKRRTSSTDVQRSWGQWRSLSFYLLLVGKCFSNRQILHLEGILVVYHFNETRGAGKWNFYGHRLRKNRIIQCYLYFQGKYQTNTNLSVLNKFA